MSFVIAAYNAANFIEESIHSALQQDDVTLEVIVVDDGSQDDTADRVKAIIKSDSRVKLINRRNGGVSAARNSGLKAACGTWIAILDADDFVAPERSIRLITLAGALKSDLVSDNVVRFLDEDREVTWPLLTFRSDQSPFEVPASVYLDRNRMLRGDQNLGYLKPMFRRQFLIDHNISYNETLRTGEDFNFCMQFLAYGAKYCIEPGAYYHYRISKTSLSKQLTQSDIDSLMSAHESITTLIPTTDIPTRKASDAYRQSLWDAAAFTSFRQNLYRREWGAALRRSGHFGLWKTVSYVALSSLQRRRAQRYAKARVHQPR